MRSSYKGGWFWASLAVWLVIWLVWAGLARAQDVTPNVVGGQYHGTARSVSDGQTVSIKVAPDGTVFTTGGAAASGGASSSFLQPAASDNHAVIKAGAGTLYGVVATNNSVTVNYLRYYNATTGFNGCNSATGLISQVAILPSGGVSAFIPVGIAFAAGLSICVTSGYATTDTTNATASAMSITTVYQ